MTLDTAAAAVLVQDFLQNIPPSHKPEKKTLPAGQGRWQEGAAE